MISVSGYKKLYANTCRGGETSISEHRDILASPPFPKH